ncbi:MAG: alkaline shock response membrane anchor protein AmaP [Clostridia bacterium]|nr:alkaline shock response membrane anchor protein AmaP [Clostridia bacterium]
MKRTVGILSGILAFAAVVSGVILLLAAIGWPITTEGLQTMIAGSRRMPAVLFLILFALVCIAIGVIVLYGMIWNRLNRRTTALLEKNALGETAVSFAALSQIVDRTLKNRTDVKSSKTRVYAIGSSVRIEVRAVTSPTVSLLKLTHSLQDEIHAAIVALCGVSIGSIDVTVDQAELPPKRN